MTTCTKIMLLQHSKTFSMIHTAILTKDEDRKEICFTVIVSVLNLRLRQLGGGLNIRTSKGGQ
jgi:hypothetical protein